MIGKLIRAFALLIICFAIGAVGSIALLFLFALLFAGAEGDAWVRWFFGKDGYIFMTSTFLLAAVAFPFVKRANLKLV